MPYEDHCRGQNIYSSVLLDTFAILYRRCQYVDIISITSSLLLLVGFINSRNEMKVRLYSTKVITRCANSEILTHWCQYVEFKFPTYPYC